jgi:Rad52/22 family double-strand break repair protein
MTAPNAHATENGANTLANPAMSGGPAIGQLPPERVKEVVAALELPFDPSQIEWRVMNTTKNQQPARGQVVPYADQRAYTDRLNALFTPAGWTRKYSIYTSANFERSKDQKIVAKVLVTCELIIFGLGSHSATGEEWADDDNAGTAAEAQSFKRACACSRSRRGGLDGSASPGSDHREFLSRTLVTLLHMELEAQQEIDSQVSTRRADCGPDSGTGAVHARVAQGAESELRYFD